MRARRAKQLSILRMALLSLFILSALSASAAASAGIVTGKGASAMGSSASPARAGKGDSSSSLIPYVDFIIQKPDASGSGTTSIELILLVTVLSVAPGLLILATSFVRISIVLDFMKRALSLQQAPSAQIMAGLALILTFFVMWPTFSTVYEKSLKPLSDGVISSSDAWSEAEKPLRLFMYDQMRESPDNIRMFMSMRGLPKPASLADVPTYVLVPAFALHELTVAFRIGILLFIPFIVIDMVVAAILMSMGMVMLPPAVISLPLKLAVFVLADGWGLLARQLVQSFR